MYVGLFRAVSCLNDGSFFELLAFGVQEARQRNVQRVTPMRATCLLTITGNIPLSTYTTIATVACADVPGFMPHTVSPQVRCKPSVFLLVSSDHSIPPARHTSTTYSSHPAICAHTQRASKSFGNAVLFTTVPPTVSWSLCHIPRGENDGTSKHKRLLTMTGGCLNCTSCAAWDKERLRPSEPLPLKSKTAAPFPLDVQPFSRLSTHCDMLLHLIHTNTTLLPSAVVRRSLPHSPFSVQRKQLPCYMGLAEHRNHLAFAVPGNPPVPVRRVTVHAVSHQNKRAIRHNSLNES
ncbi:unnamed protein product [Trypanosoma congolense IL3000]|uniref:WGS project CAEQ00000000 data, annotated contig 280 n=1 Tax=Trypanosoma congolense (strain IL3000) TaxID=1068625 RepID=F9WEK1_TRYCI|nr:unnamed protein product [Trypanosoma congolense IL3000]